MLLLLGPTVGRGVLVTGGLAAVSACADGPTAEDCDWDYDECIDACVGDSRACFEECSEARSLCLEEAQAALDRQDANAEAAEVFADLCTSALSCTFEAIGDSSDPDGDGDDGYDDGDDGDAEDDWGADWGEHNPDDVARELGAPPDLPDP